MGRKTVGLVGLWDCVAFDEVAGIKFKDKDGIQIMKDYMASGSFARGKEEKAATASMVFVGNINQSVDVLLKTSSLFAPFPQEMGTDTAFLDRMHCYLPGWEIPKFRPEHFTNDYGFISDYLAEFIRELRKEQYGDALDHYFRLGRNLNQRDTIAVRRMIDGYLKLMYPNGEFTKEELEVAHEIYLKTKAAKPKIFVYFKEEGIVDESLKDFKSYCEKNLGHFCDLYTNYDDLRLKFDKQLQILENEGFIKPDPVDVKRTLRFVLLYVLVPVLVVALAFFAFYYYSPVTSTVRLTDTSKSSLPFYGADITLEYADKSETRHVDRLSDEVVFKEIHTKYLGENARLKIESKGYVTVDTVLSLEKNVTLGISRDSSLAMIFGTVKDEDNRPLAVVFVLVLDMMFVFDGMGNFQLPIPAEKQKEEQRVTVYKDGYQLWDFTGPVSDKVPWKIFLRK